MKKYGKDVLNTNRIEASKHNQNAVLRCSSLHFDNHKVLRYIIGGMVN